MNAPARSASMARWRSTAVCSPAGYIKIIVRTNFLVSTSEDGVLISAGPMPSGMLDARAVARVDPGGMRDIIASLPDQISAAAIWAEGRARAPIAEAQRVFLIGMGGSAIAGDVFAAWVADRCKVPIQVIRDYRLPSYARPEDLLVAVSYSGNTEETLGATAEGIKLGCRVIAITSGGRLGDLARGGGWPIFEVPAGLPPRGAFGHLFGILSTFFSSRRRQTIIDCDWSSDVCSSDLRRRCCRRSRRADADRRATGSRGSASTRAARSETSRPRSARTRGVRRRRSPRRRSCSRTRRDRKSVV